jgi:hypothetical protein
VGNLPLFKGEILFLKSSGKLHITLASRTEEKLLSHSERDGAETVKTTRVCSL